MTKFSSGSTASKALTDSAKIPILQMLERMSETYRTTPPFQTKNEKQKAQPARSHPAVGT
jgi:hypothetical protein